MNKQQKQIEEMTTSLLGAYNQARQFDGALMLDTIKDMAKYLVNKYQPKIHENAVVLTREEFDEDYVTKEDRDYWKHKAEIYKEHLKKSRKETAEKIMNDISSDILVINTKEYGSIEVIPVERLQEIIQTLEVNC